MIIDGYVLSDDDAHERHEAGDHFFCEPSDSWWDEDCESYHDELEEAEEVAPE